jgi:hypothetical protein
MRRHQFRVLLFLTVPILSAVTLAVIPQSATAADPTDTIRYSRATLRDAPGRLVLANVLPGDRLTRLVYCGDWVRVQVDPRGGHALATRTGWMERTDLTRSAKADGLAGVTRDCAAPQRDGDRWRGFVTAMNAPFGSMRQIADGSWHHVTYGTRIAPLDPAGCTPSYNYSAAGPDPAQRIPGLNLAVAGYRYRSRTGNVALVAVGRANGSSGDVWGFVAEACVQPDTAAGYQTVYFPVVVRVDRMPSGPVATGALHRYGCHAPVRSPSQPAFGWWPEPHVNPACPY